MSLVKNSMSGLKCKCRKCRQPIYSDDMKYRLGRGKYLCWNCKHPKPREDNIITALSWLEVEAHFGSRKAAILLQLMDDQRKQNEELESFLCANEDALEDAYSLQRRTH